MKTTQEWSRCDPLYSITVRLNHPVMINFIEQIQLDAYKAGMLQAANYLENAYVSQPHLTSYHLNELSLNEAILETIRTDSIKLPCPLNL